MSSQFSGKTALVTGGGSGIGKAVAVALAKEGAAVVVNDLKREVAQAVVDELSRPAAGALPWPATSASPRT